MAIDGELSIRYPSCDYKKCSWNANWWRFQVGTFSVRKKGNRFPFYSFLTWFQMKFWWSDQINLDLNLKTFKLFLLFWSLSRTTCKTNSFCPRISSMDFSLYVYIYISFFCTLEPISFFSSAYPSSISGFRRLEIIIGWHRLHLCSMSHLFFLPSFTSLPVRLIDLGLKNYSRYE